MLRLPDASRSPSYGQGIAAITDDRSVPAIEGQILRLTRRREAAIYLRYGQLWVADFIGGCGELIHPITWIRFNCGSSAAPHARRARPRSRLFRFTSSGRDGIEALHRLGFAVDPDL